MVPGLTTHASKRAAGALHDEVLPLGGRPEAHALKSAGAPKVAPPGDYCSRVSKAAQGPSPLGMSTWLAINYNWWRTA